MRKNQGKLLWVALIWIRLAVNLPSFLWLWRIAAWSMGFTLLAYLVQGITGYTIAQTRRGKMSLPPTVTAGVKWIHRCSGIVMLLLVLLLLGIGLVGTIGHYGTLGQSLHLPLGLLVVSLVLASAGSALQIIQGNPMARTTHLLINGGLFFALILVSWSGWTVVQKYLPSS